MDTLSSMTDTSSMGSDDVNSSFGDKAAILTSVESEGEEVKDSDPTGSRRSEVAQAEQVIC